MEQAQHEGQEKGAVWVNGKRQQTEIKVEIGHISYWINGGALW